MFLRPDEITKKSIFCLCICCSLFFSAARSQINAHTEDIHSDNDTLMHETHCLSLELSTRKHSVCVFRSIVYIRACIYQYCMSNIPTALRQQGFLLVWGRILLLVCTCISTAKNVLCLFSQGVVFCVFIPAFCTQCAGDLSLMNSGMKSLR